MSISKEEFFKPGKLSSADKAENTNTIARQIIAAEDAQRASKTEKLRLLREQREADAAPAPARKKRG
ncbi:hypothetical protein ACQ3G6_02940 [Allorhizobium undicola]|uniref:hypothetical protein n=1 Tax=Allorhizobium undicola TaxID=78527 RepID=UPI00047F3F01|nr:hypothetical protein [Allorhizobium undicola]